MIFAKSFSEVSGGRFEGRLAALAVGVYIAKEGPAWLEREIANPTAPR